MVLRKDLGLDEVPSTVLKDEEALKQVQYIMEQTRLLMIIKES
jgi:heterodisulfide reductase subunit C